MKNFISLILALITLLSVATVMAGATEADLAQTCATYYVSNTPFEDFANANIIGYLGDLDGSKSISILDATQVQLSLASIIALGNNAKLLADVDRSGDVSILDATDIQCHLAQLETNAKVAHTLYTMKAFSTDSVAKQLSKFLEANGEFSTLSNTYSYYFKAEDGSHTTYFTYDPKKNIVGFLFTGKSKGGRPAVTLQVTASLSGEPHTMWVTFVKDKQSVSVDGTITQINENDTKVKLIAETYETTSSLTFAKDVEPVLQGDIATALADMQLLMGDSLIGNPYSLFA